MCGIAGVLSFNGKVVEASDVKKMTDAIAHRGPDGEGQWVNDTQTIGLGHRRLSIIDLSVASAQPMHLENRYSITFNGEIYNYLELREELKLKGYSFQTSGDTEVLLSLYAEYGTSMLDKLDGMFAFAIWDHQKEELFCARDRFGEKPFFYSIYEDTFVFGSEMKALWAYGIPKKVKKDKIHNYIISGALTGDNSSDTYFENIYQLDAAHSLRIGADGQVSIKNYWNLDAIKINHDISFEEAKFFYRQLFIESLVLRLRSDVAVGSSLSGGIDSSTIVCVLNTVKDQRQKQKVFSARFKDASKDEGRYIETVLAKIQNVEAYNVWPEQEEILDIMDKVIFHQEEPFGSSSILAQWKVMELAKQQNVTVLLDGQGADESLAGYMPDYKMYLTQLFFEDRKKYKSEYKAHQEKFKNIYPIDNYLSQESLRMKMGRIKKNLLKETIEYEKLKDIQKRNLTKIGLKQLLRYADRNSMAHQREIRLPFLSHKLVEFVYSLPESFLLNEGWTKYIHRKAFETELPKEVCWRVDKLGYEPPQRNWLATEKIQKIIKEQAEKYEINLAKHRSEKYTNSMDWKLLMASYY